MGPPSQHAPHEDSDEPEEEPLREIAADDVTVAIFCALVEESTAVRYTLDDEFTCQAIGESYVHTVGRIGPHNVVIAEPADIGTVNAAHCAAHVNQQFPNVRFALMVGIGAGIPSVELDVRLGDVAISAPRDDHPGMIQYDLGKYEDGAFIRKGTLNKPPRILSSAIRALEGDELRDKSPIRKILRRIIKQNDMFRRPDSEDILFNDAFPHVKKGTDCGACRASDDKKVVSRPPRPSPNQPVTHRGLILSGSGVIKNPADRDQLRRGYESAICFEMEAAGIADELPCLVIRGISDYADTHKNDGWRCYAAAVAAAYCKAVLLKVQGKEIKDTPLMRELINKVDNIRGIFEENLKTMRDTRATEHLNKIQKWLEPPDSSTNFNNAKHQRHEGTGQWLLRHDQYAKWKTEHNSFLWLHGIPGCGKTVLSSVVISDLQTGVTSQGLVYFYFDFNDTGKQSVEKAIRSLVCQLLWKRKKLRCEVDAVFASCQNGGSQPDITSLSRLFERMIRQAGPVWIVLDALDECNGGNDGLLPWIQGLRQSDLNVHVLVTSRLEQDIKASLEPCFEVIPLQSHISGDINSYIKAKTRAIERWKTMPGQHKKIEDVLVREANGMFRWVSCQLEELVKCPGPRDVDNTLKHLPKTLSDTYARILQSISYLQRESTIRLLQFLTYSGRPLQVEEAVDVVAVNLSGQPRFHPAHRIPILEEVVRYCSSLVTLVERKDGESGRTVKEIQLAHSSVREYLTSDGVEQFLADGFKGTNARAAIVEVCLSYLLDLDHPYDEAEKEQQRPLLQYSAQYWSTHAAFVEESQKEISPIVEEYLLSKVAYEFGWTVYPPDAPWNPLSTAAPPLYYASFAGLLYSVKLMLEKDFDVNDQGGYYGNALQAAVVGGHKSIVTLLLKSGANPKLRGGKYGYALQAASAKGHEDIANLLLNYEAEVDAQVKDQGSALYLASLSGHKKVVSLLLNKGANVNAKGGRFGNALQAACLRGEEEVVKLLLKKKADVNAEGGRYGFALQAASAEGWEKVVQLLLEADASVNAQGRGQATALYMASFGGHENVVRLLLNKGADVNAKGGDGDPDSALEAADAEGWPKVAKLLRERGAGSSPNRKRPTDQTAGGTAELPSKRRETKASCQF